VVEEQDVKGVTRATHVYGRYLDEVLTMDRGGQTLYYHQNASYSTYALSSASAALIEGYRYDPYGRQTVFTPGPNGVVDFGGDDIVFAGGASSVGNPHTFTGRQLDAETGLLFYRARHYDPAKGRFVQRDPVDYAGGPNLYEYTRSNPLNRVDPSGLAEVTIDPATVDGIGYGVGTEARPEGRSLVFMKVTGTCCECNQAAVAAGTDKEKKYGIRKIVIAFRLALFVSPAISRGEAGADGGTLRGTYGHEQKHLVMMMKEIKKNKAAIEKLFAPLEEACELSEKKCNEQMTARFVQGKADIAQTVAPFITYGYDHAGAVKADGHPTAKEQPEPQGDVKPMAQPFPPKGEEAGWYLFPSSIYKEAYRASLKKKK
jgi:RHS repeat-associated protein